MPRSDLERRYGPGIHEHTRRLVEAAGLTFDPSPTLPNTSKALQVTELARDSGLHGPATRASHARLLVGEAQDLVTNQTLLELVQAAGLDRDEAAGPALADRRYARPASDRLDAGGEPAGESTRSRPSCSTAGCSSWAPSPRRLSSRPWPSSTGPR